LIVPPVPVPLTPEGADGTPAGVTDAEEVEAEAELPAVFVAVEVNVYAVPFVNGAIVQLVPGETMVQVAPPGDAVTVYEEGVPPEVGAAIVIVAEPFPGVAVGIPGIPGAEMVHCAVSVMFPETFEISVAAFVVVAPSLQPVNVNPVLVGVAAVVNDPPDETFACVGAVPTPPFNA